MSADATGVCRTTGMYLGVEVLVLVDIEGSSFQHSRQVTPDITQRL
jgi:hypothetical protein